MKWMIASDLHGSAYYCRALLQAWDREQADRLILLGGEFRPISRTLVGPLTAPVGEALHIDKAFFGTIGITADGLSTTDPGEAYTKKLMLRRAHKAILLACASLVASGSLRDLDIVITDRGLSPEFARLLRRNKIEVVTQ